MPAFTPTTPSTNGPGNPPAGGIVNFNSEAIKIFNKFTAADADFASLATILSSLDVNNLANLAVEANKMRPRIIAIRPSNVSLSYSPTIYNITYSRLINFPLSNMSALVFSQVLGSNTSGSVARFELEVQLSNVTQDINNANQPFKTDHASDQVLTPNFLCFIANTGFSGTKTLAIRHRAPSSGFFIDRSQCQTIVFIFGGSVNS